MRDPRRLRLSGQVALVTGAARGLGRGIAVRPVHDGARVALADRAPEVMEVAAALAGDGDGTVCDVADSAAIERLVRDIAQRHGRAPQAGYITGTALPVDGDVAAGRVGVRPLGA